MVEVAGVPDLPALLAGRYDAGDTLEDPLPAWLRERRRRGWTLSELADAVGHSTHWVRWRIDTLSPPLET